MGLFCQPVITLRNQFACTNIISICSHPDPSCVWAMRMIVKGDDAYRTVPEATLTTWLWWIFVRGARLVHPLLYFRCHFPAFLPPPAHQPPFLCTNTRIARRHVDQWAQNVKKGRFCCSNRTKRDKFNRLWMATPRSQTNVWKFQSRSKVKGD